MKTLLLSERVRGGIIARLAIRRMELEGKTHNISHYISFDAPHKGANIPLGLQSLVFDLDETNAIQSFAGDEIDEFVDMINSPAARQLLLQFRTENPNSGFVSMQNQLNNIGFPREGGIRNISIVNGALDGSIGESGFANVEGTKILDLIDTFDTAFAPIQFFARVFSNDFNSRSQVSFLGITVFGIRNTNKRAFFNYGALNYDIAAGSGSERDLIVRGLERVGEFRFRNPFRNFAFVPLFSSMASTRNITNQTELNRSYDFLRVRGQIPFDRVFGRNDNTEHISAPALFVAWRNLLSTELGLNLSTTCSDVPSTTIAPPTPRANAPFFFTCQNTGRDVTFFVDNDSDDLGSDYTHRWFVTGPRNFSANGNTLTMRSTLPTGVYSIRLTRSFSDALLDGLPAADRNRVRGSSSSRSFTLLSSRDRRCSGGGGGSDDPPCRGCAPGGGIPLTVDLGDFETEDKGEMVIWPNPSSDIINVSYKVEEDSEVLVSLVSIDNAYDNAISLGAESRSPGEYTDGFDIGQLAAGVYILIVDINGVQTKRKVINVSSI